MVGLIYIHFDYTSVFDKVTFSGNTSTLNGGAMYISVSAAPVFKNIQITGNKAGNYGGAAFISNNADYTVSFLNTVISGNSSINGAVYTQTANFIMQNSIVYGNSHGIISTGGSNPNTIVYSLVQGIPAIAANNIMNGTIDPLFVTPDSYNNAPSTAGN
jgi:hypothetical protein